MTWWEWLLLVLWGPATAAGALLCVVLSGAAWYDRLRETGSA